MLKMYSRKTKTGVSSIVVNESYEGEMLEKKVRRIVQQNEPITDGAERIFTERKDGVRPEYDIRTDRFELAVSATDFMANEHVAKRAAKMSAVKGGEGKESVAATGTDMP